jgi:GTP-binding protein Era
MTEVSDERFEEFDDLEGSVELFDFDPEYGFAALEALEAEGGLAGVGDAGTFFNTPEGFKSGFVSVVGRPNAGKSTLINALVGHKVAIVSNTAQTTRTRIRAVVTKPEFQIVFCDTPGLHKPHDVLGEELNSNALRSLEDTDVVVMALDASATVGSGDEWVASRIKDVNAPKICALTKCDLVDGDTVRRQFEAARKLCDWDAFVALSAKSDYNLDAFLEEVVSFLPEGPAWFPPDMDTDQSDEMLVSELIREKILRSFYDEVPHSVGVLTDEMTYVKKKNLFRIFATIYVERDSQKAMIVGRKGASIKKIGSAARKELEHVLGARVFLDLNVKTKRNWRRDEAQLTKLGYMETF